MKKTIKRLISIFTLATMLVTIIPSAAQAAKVGDLIGYAEPTDIVAMINGYQLQSYNVNGYTYVVAEDLRYYGFDVVFDLSSKVLSIKRNPTITWINPQAYNVNFWNIGADNTKKNILYTDIATYVNNYYVPAYNINGLTIIKFDELSRYGEMSYDNDRRMISLNMTDANYNNTALLSDILQNIANSSYDKNWTYLYRAKGDVMMLTVTSRTNSWQQSKRDNFINNTIEKTEKTKDRNNLITWKSGGWNVSSYYVEYHEGDGRYITSYQLY